MKKTLPAFIAAILVTVILGAGMFMIGQSAVGASSAQAAAATTNNAASAATVTQYEQLISQYQARETQYQGQIAQAIGQINTANQQLTTDSQQIQQYQSLISQLQNSGLITVGSDGTVTINQASRSGFQSFFGDDHGDSH